MNETQQHSSTAEKSDGRNAINNQHIDKGHMRREHPNETDAAVAANSTKRGAFSDDDDDDHEVAPRKDVKMEARSSRHRSNRRGRKRTRRSQSRASSTSNSRSPTTRRHHRRRSLDDGTDRKRHSSRRRSSRKSRADKADRSSSVRRRHDQDSEEDRSGYGHSHGHKSDSDRSESNTKKKKKKKRKKRKKSSKSHHRRRRKRQEERRRRKGSKRLSGDDESRGRSRSSRRRYRSESKSKSRSRSRSQSKSTSRSRSRLASKSRIRSSSGSVSYSESNDHGRRDRWSRGHRSASIRDDRSLSSSRCRQNRRDRSSPSRSRRRGRSRDRIRRHRRSRRDDSRRHRRSISQYRDRGPRLLHHNDPPNASVRAGVVSDDETMPSEDTRKHGMVESTTVNTGTNAAPMEKVVTRPSARDMSARFHPRSGAVEHHPRACVRGYIGTHGHDPATKHEYHGRPERMPHGNEYHHNHEQDYNHERNCERDHGHGRHGDERHMERRRAGSRDLDRQAREQRQEQDDASKAFKSPSSGRDDTVGHFRANEGVIADRYQIIREVGMGTFGRVVECLDLKRARSHRHGRQENTVAIKIVRNIKRYYDSALIEADIVEEVNRRGGRGLSHVAVLYNTFSFSGHYCLAFEALGPSLYDFLKRHDYQPFPIICIRDFATQLLETLDFLHSMRLIHTDLKPENVLLLNHREELYRGYKIPECTKIKIIDFGGATYDHEKKSSIINTRQYRAPEVMLGVGWSMSSDLWSLGCILAELYQGELLFATHDSIEHLALIEQVIGPFSRRMIRKGKHTDVIHDAFDSTGSHRMERVLPPESIAYVKRVAPLESMLYQDDHRSHWLLRLLRRLLIIDPNDRWTAVDCLRQL